MFGQHQSVLSTEELVNVTAKHIFLYCLDIEMTFVSTNAF